MSFFPIASRSFTLLCFLAVNYSINIFSTVLSVRALPAQPIYRNKMLAPEESSLGLLKVTEVASGFRYPWSLSWVPSKAIIGVLGRLEILLGSSGDSNGYFTVISERNGGLWLLWQGQVAKLSGIPDDVIQRGQAGYFALHYVSSEQRLYLSYSQAAAGRNSTLALVSFQLRHDENGFHTANLRSEFQAQPTEPGVLQYGGAIASDGQWLYLSIGDRRKRNEAQNPRSYWGSIVRLPIKTDRENIADRPVTLQFPNSQAGSPLPYMYSIGHRNPQGLAFDAVQQILWSTEHGPQGGDELNRIEGGRNYGWPTITYGVEYGSSAPIGEGTAKTGLEQPLRYWVPSSAPAGIAVLTARSSSSLFAKWKGNLLIPMLRRAELLRIVPNSQEIGQIVGRSVKAQRNQQEEVLFHGRFGRLRWVGQGPDGAIYLLTDSALGRLLRISQQ